MRRSAPQPPEPFESREQDEPREKREVRDVIPDLAREGSDKRPSQPVSEDEYADALDWFLADSDDADETYTFQINVGTPVNRRWVDWTIRPVDMDRLRRIRREAQAKQNRRARRNGQQAEMDDMTANIQVVLEGTVTPDLRDAARRIGTVDPSVAVRSRFAHKPGLVAQIAGEIMSLSGYDDEDIREVDAARG